MKSEIHPADWGIPYPADLDEKCVPGLLRSLTHVDHDWDAFPWHLADRMIGLLETPEASFEYLHLTVYLRARAAMLVLKGHVLNIIGLHTALSKYQVQVGGIYRKHMLYHLQAFLKKHNMAQLPVCDMHSMDPLHDPGQTEKNRDLIRRVMQKAEIAYLNTLNFISESPEMTERIAGESVEFWVERRENHRAINVRVRVTRHKGWYEVKPCREEAKRLFSDGRTAGTFAVRLQEELPFGKASGCDHRPRTTDSGGRTENRKMVKGDDTIATVAQKAAELVLASVAPALRCSKLNPDRGATDDLVQAFALERRNHATDRETFGALARLDIETARKTPDKAPWMRPNDAKRHYRRAVQGDPLKQADIEIRVDALERRHRRAIKSKKSGHSADIATA